MFRSVEIFASNMYALSQTSLVSGRVQTASIRSHCRSAQSLRPAKGLRRSVIRFGGEGSGYEDRPGMPPPKTNQNIEQVDDVKEPAIDQTKPENIVPGNISNENAERRADIGATRPPTLLGTLALLKYLVPPAGPSRSQCHVPPAAACYLTIFCVLQRHRLLMALHQRPSMAA